MDLFENVSVLLQFAVQPITLQTLSNIRRLNNLFSMNSRFQLSGRYMFEFLIRKNYLFQRLTHKHKIVIMKKSNDH